MGTQLVDDPLVPRWLLSLNDLTTALWRILSSDVRWYARLHQEYEQGTLDMKGYLGDQAFRGLLRGWGL